MYPADQRKPEGKLRPMCEANPGTSGRTRPADARVMARTAFLEKMPNKLHARTPLFIGSRKDGEAVENIYADYDAELGRRFGAFSLNLGNALPGFVCKGALAGNISRAP